MKKLFIVIPTFFIAGALCAQTSQPPYVKKAPHKKQPRYDMNVPGSIPADSLAAKIGEWSKTGLYRNGMPNPIPLQKMPNSIIATPAPDVYVGNNGKGHDIYRSQIDNMPIVKPDSTFATNIPSINRTRPRYPRPVRVEPSVKPR